MSASGCLSAASVSPPQRHAAEFRGLESEPATALLPEGDRRDVGPGTAPEVVTLLTDKPLCL